MMFTKFSVAVMGALALVSNAAIVSFFSDQNCADQFNSRNIFDNTCATGTGGYQSFKITTPGGSGQMISAFSQDACALDVTICVDAGAVGTCFPSVNGHGGSNAISSSPVCGSA